MLSIFTTRTHLGLNALPVKVEAHIANGLSKFIIVGLPEAAVRESRDRVRSAIINSGFEFPQRRITVNLAPADFPKEGGRFDLAIALGVLAASKQIKLSQSILNHYEVIGELGLSGELRSIKGLLPAALGAQTEQKALILPKDNQSEAALLPKLEAYAAPNLKSVTEHLSGENKLEPILHQPYIPKASKIIDLSDVKGQTQAKQALIIAAAGGHNLLMQGPPGTGKTLLASRLPSILPDLTEQQALENAVLASIKGITVKAEDFFIPAFRHPHHSSSAIALVGGGSPPKPGEISLAHHGVLFLDELPEFDRKVLEMLREPMESRKITISRAKHQVDYPANFQIIAAMNPCPCGYLTSTKKNCVCSSLQKQRYANKLSGPLLDRFDLHVDVNDLDISELVHSQNKNLNSKSKSKTNSHSHSIKIQIQNTRMIQINRQNKLNAHLTSREIGEYCALDSNLQKFTLNAVDKLNLSARAYHRVLKLARTLADLENIKNIDQTHISKALGYRSN